MTTRSVKHRSQDDGFSDNMEQVGEDLSDLKDGLVKAAHDVAETAASGVAVAKRQVSKGLDTAKEQTKELATVLTEHVQSKPWTSIAIAAGAGLLVGMLMCRRD